MQFIGMDDPSPAAPIDFKLKKIILVFIVNFIQL